MKNVLLPTDLTVQSLTPVHQVVRDAKNEKLVISIVHMLSLPTSITDLLFLEDNKPYDKVPGNFIEGYEMLSNKYKKVLEKLEFKFLYCSNSRYLNNYLEGHRVDKVYMLDHYRYKEPLQQSQKFTGFIEKCKVPLVKLPLRDHELLEYQILSSLLSGNDTKGVNAGNSGKKAISYS